MYAPVVPQKPYPIPDQNGESVFRPKRPKNPSLGAINTYLYSLYKGVPPAPLSWSTPFMIVRDRD